MSSASSPCNGTCTIDEPRGLCLGCGRTVEEIIGWGEMAEPQRLGIMATLAQRITDAGARLGEGQCRH